MPNQPRYIFRSNGTYVGFIHNGFIFSRDGVYLASLDGTFIWDSKGKFVGRIIDLGGHEYALINKFTIPPVPKTPKEQPSTPALPPPPANIAPITLPVEWADTF